MFFTGKPLKDKNPKALVIHPLNEITEFVDEGRKLISEFLNECITSFPKTRKPQQPFVVVSDTCRNLTTVA